ncbi:Calmodulin [Balamuthia mandrillaris]
MEEGEYQRIGAKYGLSKTQLEQYKQCFLFFDSDGDGSVGSRELTSVLTKLGEQPSEEEVQDMIHEVDVSNTNKIGFEDFLRMMIRRGFFHFFVPPLPFSILLPAIHLSSVVLFRFFSALCLTLQPRSLASFFLILFFFSLVGSLTPEEKESDLKATFNAFDTDGNGYIDRVEFKHAMELLGESNLPETAIDSLMKEVDLDGNGMIDFDEFKKMLASDQGVATRPRKRGT